MTDLIRVPESAIPQLSFDISSLVVDDFNCEFFDVATDVDDDGNAICEKRFQRSVWGTVVLKAIYNSQPIVISFCWEAYAPITTVYRDSFDFDIDYAPEPSMSQNFVVFDDDGDSVGLSVAEIEEDAAGFEDFRVRVKAGLPTAVVEVLFEHAGDNMSDVEEFTLTRDGGPDLSFKGVQIGFATNKDPYQQGGRWFNLRLWKTAGGKYICQKEDVTCRQGERDRSKVEVCETIDEVKQFFGQGWASKNLYYDAKIENIEHVE